MNTRHLGRQAVILAGGLGTRMLPKTERVPKILLEVAGRPFSHWLLERLAACGYQRIVLCVGHLGEMVRDEVGDGKRHGLEVRYVDEGKDLRGTGGALVLARQEGLLDDDFLVTYGDSYLPFDYRAPLDMLRNRPDFSGVMAVYANASRWDSSNVVLSDEGSGDRVARYQKGTRDPLFRHIDYGATALRQSTLDRFPDGARFGLDALQHTLAAEGTLGASLAEERFFEIGSPDGLADLETHLVNRP